MNSGPSSAAQAAPPTSSPKARSVFRGTLIVVATRWSDRAVGFVSMLILARLLTPADFGLVALAMVVVGFIDVVLDVGVDIQLVRNPHATHDDYDTAWTIRIIQGALAMIVILVSAPFAGAYFNDTRINTILFVIAPMLVVSALGNIGIIELQKRMDFGREFQYLFTRRCIAFAVTISATLMLRSYWGLVIGTVANSICGTILSYAFHSYRPRLSLAQAHRMWRFSTWLMLRSMGTYTLLQLDKVVLGRRDVPDMVGAYKLADELATLPTTDLLAPLGRALFPALAQDQDDPGRLRQTFVLALGVSTLIVIPAGLGLSLIADVAVPALLGHKWTAAIPILQILGLTGMIAAFAHSSQYLLLALGRFKALTIITYVQIAVFLALVFSAVLPATASGIAMARLASTLLATLALATVGLAGAQGGIRASDWARAAWRPAVAALAMAPLVHWLPVTGLPPLGQVVAKASAGAIFYAGAVLVLWWTAGRPSGAEQYLLDKLRRRVLPIVPEPRAPPFDQQPKLGS
jgi:lipopolysaccharide exporter